MREMFRDAGLGVFFVWLFCLAATLVFWGVVVWAIIRLVNHYT